ncbi:hypothetical protein WJX84_001848 [Apatococcus fuscideae]|uniref:Protein MON2 homolog n=1 Tax=Apatococcus fuscideae TaxID=2026836 RepID=A0AAW1TJ43_9CHLO
MGLKGDEFYQQLENDLKQLAGEAKRSDTFTGQLSGLLLLSGPEHPHIREATDRSLAKLRAWKEDESGHTFVIDKDFLKPFLAACESKSTKLTVAALVSLQKQLANDAILHRDVIAVVHALEQVEKLHDEGPQLKLLQTSLTLLQSPAITQNEDAIAAVLGICFRSLANAKNTDSVVSTAAATVRQAVALVFENVLTINTEKNGALAAISPMADAAAGVSQTLSAPGSPGSDASTSNGPLSSHAATAPGSLNAALKLLEDLCVMATASEAMLRWLKAPALPRSFVLDLLDFVLANHATVFRVIPAFEHALLVRISQLLITRLQNLLDPAGEPATHTLELKVVLRVTRTTLKNFYLQLHSKCGVFIEALLAGSAAGCTLWQRISVMQIIRQLCSDAHFINFLCSIYDVPQDSKVKLVHKLVLCCTTTADDNTGFSSGHPDEVAVNAVASLYQSRAHGKDWHMDTDYGQASLEVGGAYLTTVAIDCLLALVSAFEKLTDIAVEDTPATPKAQGSRIPVTTEACTVTMTASWRAILGTLSQLLAHSSGEELILNLLRGYQLCTQACGILDLNEARDAFLSSLCDFTLSAVDESSLQAATSGLDVTSPSSAKGTRGQPPDIHRSQSGKAEAGEGMILTPKNVQALRTLFNIAHRLDHKLGSSWVLVLGNLNTLDRILHSPRTTTQEVSAGPAGSLPADLAILATAADQLFESTSRMSTDSVENMLTALQTVSNGSIPAAAAQPGPPKLFALGRMVETLLFNVSRIHSLWPTFLNHLMEVLGNQKVAVRIAGLDALAKSTSGILTRIIKAGPNDPEGQVDESAVENMLVASIESLYSEDDYEPDIRKGLLRIILQILQRHGEQLTAGWLPMLRLLAKVPQGDEVEVIGLAFQSVQLLCSDYMSSLSFEMLQRSLEVAALYGSQQMDMNVSLTAVGLLWNASDLISKLHSKLPLEAVAADSSSPAPSPSFKIDAVQYEELIRQLFGALQGLSTDPRPEIRNSGMRTFFTVVVSQGAKLTTPVWDELLWEMMFPLLHTVHHISATSSKEEANPEVLGKLRGVSVKMLVHHSRNSEQKQWDETLVLALAGMARLLKSHLPLLLTFPAFAEGWEDLMKIVESSMASGRKETAMAAIAIIASTVQAHGSSRVLTHAMWKRAMQALHVGIQAAACPGTIVPLQARLDLVSAISQMQVSLHEVFDSSDFLQIFGWLETFIKHPVGQDDPPFLSGTLPAVQKAALGMLPTFLPLQLPDLWPDLIMTVLHITDPSLLESTLGHDGCSPRSHRTGLSSFSMEKVVDLLLQLYRDHAPWQAKATTFAAVISSLGQCMALRYTAYAQDLWRVAAGAFNAVIAAGLPAVNIAFVNQETSMPEEAWPSLAEAYRLFLLGSGEQPEQLPSTPSNLRNGMLPASPSNAKAYLSNGPAALDQHHLISGDSRNSLKAASHPVGAAVTEPSEVDSDEALGTSVSQMDAELEAAVLDTLTETVLVSCANMPSESRQQLVSIVDQGLERGRARNIPNSAAGSRYTHLCLRKMYVLCSRGAEASGAQLCLLQVAQITLPIFLARCDTILKAYAAVIRAGKDGLDAMQTDELLCVLEILATMSISSAVADAALEGRRHLQALTEVRRKREDHVEQGRERTHLFALYSGLCLCTSTRDVRVSQLLQDVLLAVGEELQLA